MNRQGEHGGVVLKDAGGAIALMNIEIDDEHAWGKALGLHEPGRHGRIIKAAESTPPIIGRMVGAAGQIKGQTNWSL